MKDYNKDTVENLKKELIEISHKVKKPFSKKKELKKEYMKVLNKMENLKIKSQKTSKKKKKSVKKWGKVGENGVKIFKK